MEGEEEVFPPAKSSSTKPFSSGLRVLAVHNNATSLKIVETMLRDCKYEGLLILFPFLVMTVKHAYEALSILREKQNRFDIVLTDVHMPDMNGISLLEHIGLEFSLPVVMMSADDKEDTITSCLKRGASFYLVKPLSMSDLRNLWQFVFLKKCTEMMEIEQIESVQEASPPEKVSEEETDCASSVKSNCRQEPKGNIPKEKDQEDEEDKDEPNPKKPRLIWNTEVQKKFLEAIDVLGIDRAAPRKIHKLMNVPGLTRVNVASHLQKCRIQLKQNEASQSAESILARLLTSGNFGSSFASSNPLQRFNLEQRFPRIPEQQNAFTALQPRLGSCSMPQPTNGNSIQTSSQGMLKQPLLGTGPSHNQQNDSNYSGFNMETHNNRMGSSLGGDISTGLVTAGVGTSLNIHQPPLVRTGQFANGSLDHNVNTSSLPRNNNQSVGRIGSFSNHQQVPNSNYTNDNCAGIQNTSTRELVGLNQMPIGRGPPSNGTNHNNNMIDEIYNINTTLGAAEKSPPIPDFTSLHSDYATQGLASSSGSASENQFPTMFTNVGRQLPPGPPLLLPEQQNGIGVGEEVHDSLFNLIENSSTFKKNITSSIIR